MQTVAAPPKNIKVFYCTLDGASGLLTQVAGQILYMRYDDGAIIVYAPEMAPRLVVLGDCAIAQTQALLDRLHGSYAQVACSRAQELR